MTVKGGLERKCNTAPGKYREGNTNLFNLELKPDDRRSTVRLAREKVAQILISLVKGGMNKRGVTRVFAP